MTTPDEMSSRALASVESHIRASGLDTDEMWLDQGIVVFLRDLLHLLDQRNLEFNDLYERAYKAYSRQWDETNPPQTHWTPVQPNHTRDDPSS